MRINVSYLFILIAGLALVVAAPLAEAQFEGMHSSMDLLWSPWSIGALALFVACYSLVPMENVLHLRKSKPVLFAAGVIWILAALAYRHLGRLEQIEHAVQHNVIEYAELLLFLLTAMTFINSLEERNVFQVLRSFLVSRGFSLRQVFWTTGVLSFLLSPVADNLTTALLMGAVVMAVGGHYQKFVSVACINVVVAANAGGAFSPFGDITTLMVWQSGKVAFFDFFHIFIPALISWLVPAVCMSYAVPAIKPETEDRSVEQLKSGAFVIMFLFGMSIVMAVIFHSYLMLPPALGMMFGLAMLGLFAHYLRMSEGKQEGYDGILGAIADGPLPHISSILDSDVAVSQLVEHGRYPAFAIDSNHLVTHWNRAMEALTGLKASAVVGTSRHWSAFYNSEQKLLADLVVRETPREVYDIHYQGGARPNQHIDSAYDAVRFFPNLGGGKWLTFTAVPIKGENGAVSGCVEVIREVQESERESVRFDFMQRVSRAEWDTLLFFYGVILSVGGLALFGFLDAASLVLYSSLGATIANSAIGVISALLDNIPVMFAVLTMNPDMSVGQWLLVTLTAGVGGSMLSIGSAAGVALMGTARGKYTFLSHLQWLPAIALGYVLSIVAHLWLNASMM